MCRLVVKKKKSFITLTPGWHCPEPRPSLEQPPTPRRSRPRRLRPRRTWRQVHQGVGVGEQRGRRLGEVPAPGNVYR
jgi:hypothetical protein